MNVKCIGQLLTCWLEQAPKREVRALCEQLQQCIGDQGNDGLTAVVHDGTPTVDLQGQGTAAQPLTATVNVSSEPGNALTVKPSGLYVQAGGEAGDTLPPIEMPDDEHKFLTVLEDGTLAWAVIPAAESQAVTNGYATGNAPIVTGGSASAFGANSSAGGVNALALGSNAQVSAGNAVAVGANAKGTAGYATAIGPGTTASGADSLSAGRGSVAAGQRSIALRGTTTTSAPDGIAIGTTASAQGSRTIALGNDAITGTLVNSIAIGTASRAPEYQSVALGSAAEARHSQAVALGAGSQSSRDDQIAVASLTGDHTSLAPRYVSGVRNPDAPQDAVNLQFLDTRFSQAARTAVDALDPATATLANLITALQATTS